MGSHRCHLQRSPHATPTSEALPERRALGKGAHNTHSTCALHEKHGEMLIVRQYFSQLSRRSQPLYLFKRWSPGLSSHAPCGSTPASDLQLGARKESRVLATRPPQRCPVGGRRQAGHRAQGLGPALAKGGCMCHHQSAASDGERRVWAAGTGGTSRWRGG